MLSLVSVILKVYVLSRHLWIKSPSAPKDKSSLDLRNYARLRSSTNINLLDPEYHCLWRQPEEQLMKDEDPRVKIEMIVLVTWLEERRSLTAQSSSGSKAADLDSRVDLFRLIKIFHRFSYSVIDLSTVAPPVHLFMVGRKSGRSSRIKLHTMPSTPVARARRMNFDLSEMASVNAR